MGKAHKYRVVTRAIDAAVKHGEKYLALRKATKSRCLATMNEKRERAKELFDAYEAYLKENPGVGVIVKPNGERMHFIRENPEDPMYTECMGKVKDPLVTNRFCRPEDDVFAVIDTAKKDVSVVCIHLMLLLNDFF